MAEKSKEYYLREYAAIRPCDPEEAAALFLKKARGDVQALNRLLEGHMYRVNEAAEHFTKSTNLYMDLVQEGSMALFLQLQEESGFDEELYARLDRAIFDAMERFIEEEAESGKAAEELRDRLNLIDRACVLLAEKHGREATAEEVAEAVEMDADDVRYLMRIALNAIKRED